MSSRPFPKQWEIMLEFFENNPEMVSGRAATPNAKQVIKEKWETLATRLNSLGYTNKSVEKWQKTWVDFKSALKKKASEIRKYQTETGGGPPHLKNLGSYEERALQLLANSFIGLNLLEAGLTPSVTSVDGIQHQNNMQQTNCGLIYSSVLSSFTASSSTATSCTSRIYSSVLSTSAATSSAASSSTATSSTSRVEKRQRDYEDHNYIKRKNNDNSIEEAYGETITVLKNIENKLCSIDEKMDSKARSLQIIAEKI